MTVRWSLLRDRVLRILDDADRNRATWSNLELTDYINSGLTAFASHTALEKTLEVVTTEAKTMEVFLPEDYIEIGPVYYTYNFQRILLRNIHLHPGQSMPSSSWMATPYGDKSFFEYPGGQLNFILPIPTSITLYVAYYAYYPLVTNDNDLIDIPRWAEEAMIWYMQMLAMSKPSVQASILGQYKTKIDSGVPTDNPLMKHVLYCQTMYDSILSEHEIQDRTGWEAA